MIVGFKEKKVSLGTVAGYFLVDIFFLPFIACVFIIENLRGVTIDELMFHTSNLPVVRNYLNVFFFFKIILIVGVVALTIKKKYAKFGEIESVIPECKKP